MLKIKLDNSFTNYILDKTTIFGNIHPNYITLFGIAMNFVTIYYLFGMGNISNNQYSFALILFFRWFADCLDGNVARKYNKTSKLGNILDSISDLMMMTIFYLYTCWKIYTYLFTMFMTFIYLYMGYFTVYENNIFESHDKLKKGGDMIKNGIVFLVNNSFILYMVMYFYIMGLDIVM